MSSLSMNFRYRCFALLTSSMLMTSVVLSHAQTLSIPGGSVSIDSEGNFSGTVSDTDQDEVTETEFRGNISPDGRVTGGYSSTSTYNQCCTSSGGIYRESETTNGPVSGTFNRSTGEYSVSWGGPSPGSRSGTIDVGSGGGGSGGGGGSAGGGSGGGGSGGGGGGSSGGGGSGGSGGGGGSSSGGGGSGGSGGGGSAGGGSGGGSAGGGGGGSSGGGGSGSGGGGGAGGGAGGGSGGGGGGGGNSGEQISRQTGSEKDASNHTLSLQVFAETFIKDTVLSNTPVVNRLSPVAPYAEALLNAENANNIRITLDAVKNLRETSASNPTARRILREIENY